jgi:HK97 family phage major capsid protein
MNMSLVELREELIEATAAFDAAREAIEEAAKDPSKADVDSLRASFEAAEEKYNATKTEHARAEDRERKARELFDLERKAEDAGKRLTPAPSGGGERVSVGREPLTYRKHGEHSIFTDLYRQQMHGDQAAAQRLARHNKEMQFERGLKNGDIPRDAQFDLNSTDATGGYLVAPLWLNEEFVNLARAGRVAADVLGPRSLPPKTDSINLPRMSTGTAVAVQSDNSTVQETDAAFDTISGDVKTIAGLQDVSQQLVDRSVPGVDEVIYSDLVKAYAVALDVAVLNSSTANNKGLLQASGTNTVTYTQATPTVATLYPKIADAIQQINTNVFLPPDAIIMHPRRWAHVLAGLDTTNRPLVSPIAPMNPVGGFDGVVAQGLVGSIQGVNVYVDPNIPTNTGASTNQDSIIVLRTDECFLYEDQSGPYLETFRDVGSGTLTVRFRLHNYYAQINERRPKAITLITGTGLVTPSF